MEDHHLDPQLAEECAYEVVDCIRQFIDVLRMEFPTRNPPLRVSDDNYHHHHYQSLPLYTRMVEQGILQQVQKTIHRQEKEGSISPHLSAPAHSRYDEKSDQRTLLLHEIILPLLCNLTSWYRILDNLPQSPPSLPAPMPLSSSVSTSTSMSTSSEGPVAIAKKNKPDPPKGMLSLQQYTDIACLLEFIVCTWILPQLDPNVLISLDNRIRHNIPKSLVGRIPCTSLAWGASQGVPANLLLLETVTALSDLILLDRFRPMLLPRHIADIYAALLQWEQNCPVDRQTTPPQLSSLHQVWGLQASARNTNTQFDDATLQAKAYQTLLLQGTKTPAWLRQRVAPLLTELACTNLAAIVQVFVPLQQQQQQDGDREVSSMASQRLGKTLATSSAGNPHYTQQLGKQIRLLLEVLFSTVGTPQVPARAMAILQTIWAVLYHWPIELLQKQLVEPWQRTLLRNNGTGNHNIHKTIRQIGSLCASVAPPATEPWRILQLLFQRPVGISQPSASIMTLLVRLASIPNVHFVKSSMSEDARRILYWLSQATAASTSPSTSIFPSGLAFLASAWVDALAPNIWDIAGYSYHVLVPVDESMCQQESITDTKLTSLSLEAIGIQESIATEPTDLASIIAGISKRADILFETCLEPCTVDATNNAPLQGLTSMVFQLLLKLYLSGSHWISPTSVTVHWTHQLVPIIFLPTLCEKCSPETLLFGPSSNTDALGLLHSIKLVLRCTQKRLTLDEHGTDISLEELTKKIEEDASLEDDNDNIDDDQGAMICYLGLLRIGELSDHLEQFGANLMKLQDDKEQMDTLLSIASIVLSLLIAVLELGSKLRSRKEEKELESFLSILASLAKFRSPCNSSVLADQGANAGISDMAGYAMALIASRKAQPTSDTVTSETSTSEKVQAVIQQAREDLDSTQPPIRARGMVSLGRLARGYLGILNPNEAKPKMILELDKATSLEDDLVDWTIREVLAMSMIALSDSESYVYLAAIQTIVAIGDLRPKHVLPQLAVALVTGELDCGTLISNEQRIKLAEALMFIIRRRAAPAEYFPQLVNLIIFGSVEKIGTFIDTPSDESKRLFAIETDKYFLGVSVEEEESTFVENQKELWEEKDIRVKTGGPVYVLEVHDLIRSIRLSVLAELASVSPPSTLAPYCRLLIKLVTDILRLDTSRTTCRAAALLAREFYGCLLREADQLNGEMEGKNSSPLPLAVAIVSLADEEELLITTLQNCISGIGKYVSDPATAARSQEALEFRKEADDILVVARLIDRQNQSFNVPSIFTTMIREKPHIIEIDKLKALE